MTKVSIIQKSLILSILSLALLLMTGWSVSTQAYDCVLDEDGDGVGDGTAGANSLNNRFQVACGDSASASGINTTGLGSFASATGNNSTALGSGTSAAGNGSTALGRNASADENSTAVGWLSKATAAGSTAVGVSAQSLSAGTVSLGFEAGFNNGIAVTDSPFSIAIGYYANIKPASTGAIAIGGDGDGDDIGAEASAAHAIAIGEDAIANQPGAIALGANVVADTADTMVVGVPVHIKRNDGSSKILVQESNSTVAVRTLGELANNGGVRMRFTNTALGEEWDFASNQTGGFQFSLVGSGGAELSVATNGTVRMGPGPISNLTLFPSGNMTIEGVLTENSDRNSKQQITELDHESILDKVSALPIHEWEYKDSPDQRHIGPMAQDFHQAFNLGEDNEHIATLDMAGVALAAIQALKQENESTQLKLIEKDTAIAKLQNQMTELKQQLASVLAMTGGNQLTQIVSD